MNHHHQQPLSKVRFFFISASAYVFCVFVSLPVCVYVYVYVYVCVDMAVFLLFIFDLYPITCPLPSTLYPSSPSSYGIATLYTLSPHPRVFVWACTPRPRHDSAASSPFPVGLFRQWPFLSTGQQGNRQLNLPTTNWIQRAARGSSERQKKKMPKRPSFRRGRPQIIQCRFHWLFSV